MEIISILSFPFKLSYVLVRNLLIFKPIASLSAQQVDKALLKSGYTGFWYNTNIGLLNADGLSLSFFVNNDAQAKNFSKHALIEAQVLFREELLKRRYPKWAVSSVKCYIHSHETIMRQGGYYQYFK